MNMFKPVKAKTVKGYIDALPKERKEAIVFLHTFIQEAVPALKAHLAYNMLGYGSFPYTNYKKEDSEWSVIALANQKNYISIYVCATVGGKYIAEKYKDDLGKVSVGKSCVRFKKIEDIHLPTLKKMLKEAAKTPGFIGVKE